MSLLSRWLRVLRAAEARYREAARLAAAIAAVAGSAWDKVPLGSLDSWQAEQLAAKVAAVQLLLARGADSYVAAVLDEQGLETAGVGSLDARAFAGVAGDGRSLVTLLDEPRIRAKMLIGEGLGAQQAWDRARSSLRLMSVTAVQDAGRGADSVAMVARPHVGGYVRMLNLPSCSRCTILAGKFFRWNQGFQRHPKCDCRHVPSNEDIAGDLRTDPLGAFRSGQVTGLSRADAQAIEDGADFGQVVNAQRGMDTADTVRGQLGVTREGVTKRGLFGRSEIAASRSPGKGIRLRPESIYQIAKDRDDALRLLKRFGYLL